MRWWRSEPKIEVASLAQLQKRIAQLEEVLGNGRARVLNVQTEDYYYLKHAGVIRNPAPEGHPDYDRIEGVWDPTLGHAFLMDEEVRAHGKSLIERYAGKLPESTRALMDKAAAARWGDLPAMQNSSVGWRDVLTPRRVLAASGTQISNTTTETILCPDFTFAADYFEVGDAFKYTVLFEQSSVITTPGTQTYRLRYGGVAGTAMATSGAFAPDPTAAATSLTMGLEFWFVCRSVGSTGSFFTIGRFTPNDHDDASATTLKGNLDMQWIPASAPAVVSSLDTTAAKAISPTYTSSVNTSGTNATAHISILESLN